MDISPENFITLVMARRSIRAFKQDRIPHEILEQLIDIARVGPSAANRQPLEYLVVDNPTLCGKIFPYSHWAGYLRPIGTPKSGEEPVAWIFVLLNREIREEGYQQDEGAAVMTILLGAQSYGIGTCWLGAIDRKDIEHILGIAKSHAITDAIALGYPAEFPTMDDLKGPGKEEKSIQYYRDADGRHHVPKRRLQDILHWNSF